MSLKTFFAVLILTVSQSLHAQQSVTIVYAADMPVIGAENRGDYAELATLLKQTRASANGSPHFFLFGGASLAPSPLASFDSGSHIVDILNFLEPDAMSVTKREFSYFEDELTLRSYEAAFPFVLSNAIDNQTGNYLDGINANIVVAKNGFSLGIISILHPRVAEQYLLSRVLIQNPRNTAIRMAEQLKSNGANKIVLLHSDYFPFIGDLLQDGTIDLAIQSEPYDATVSLTANDRHPNNVVVDSLGSATIIKFDQSEENSSMSIESVVLANYEPDADVFSLISDYKSRLKSQLDRPIGLVTEKFNTLRASVRTKENGFANMVTDAMRAEAKTQIALLNAGSIRGDKRYQEGQTFLNGDLLDELPFRTRMQVIQVTGRQLILALENGLSKVEGVKGRFPHISGIKYQFSPTNPVGERVILVSINDAEINQEASYTLATTDYLAKGGDGYTMFGSANVMFEKAPTSPLISEVLGRSLRKQKSVTPIVDGRIQAINVDSE